MNRTVVKHIVLLVLGACAFAAALLLVPRDREVWEARFSYYIAPGNDGVTFLGGNKEWAERFRAPSFAHDVVAQCRARAVVEINESAVAGFVTGATIRVSREGDCVVCDFSSRADSRRSAEELAQCYLAAMSLAVDESNRECARKATAEISAALSEFEALARTARENYAEAQRAGSAAADDFRADAEKLTSKCDVLRRELSEAEREASKQYECLVVVRPLAVVDGNQRGQALGASSVFSHKGQEKQKGGRGIIEFSNSRIFECGGALGQRGLPTACAARPPYQLVVDS